MYVLWGKPSLSPRLQPADDSTDQLDKIYDVTDILAIACKTADSKSLDSRSAVMSAASNAQAGLLALQQALTGSLT